MDPLPELGGGGGGSLAAVGGARDGTLGLTHVLSGFQSEEGNLVQALSEQQPHGMLCRA
jgi:hypothetical protein